MIDPNYKCRCGHTAAQHRQGSSLDSPLCECSVDGCLCKQFVGYDAPFGPETVHVMASAIGAGILAGAILRAHDKVTALCDQIEKCSAGAEQTQASVMASGLRQELSTLAGVIKDVAAPK